MQFKCKKISLICLLALLVVVIFSVGTAYARYKTSINQTIIFETKLIDDSGKIVISSADGWVEGNNNLTLDFDLSGGDAKSGRKAYLRLTATENLDTSATVTLKVDGVEYQGVPYSVENGELLHFQMGNGTEYRFMSENDEIYWKLSDKKSMKLTVSGKGNKSLLRLVAKEK